jgi:predicted double-glycine peptidase
MRRIANALGLEMQAYKPSLPTLDDLTRENEMLFASRRSDHNHSGR